jgi:hypothetical protein
MTRPATLDHELDATIEQAARFLIEVPVEQRLMPTIPLLRERFGLGPADGVKAIRIANTLRAGGSHG